MSRSKQAYLPTPSTALGRKPLNCQLNFHDLPLLCSGWENETSVTGEWEQGALDPVCPGKYTEPAWATRCGENNICMTLLLLLSLLSLGIKNTLPRQLKITGRHTYSGWSTTSLVIVRNKLLDQIFTKCHFFLMHHPIFWFLWFLFPPLPRPPAMQTQISGMKNGLNHLWHVDKYIF